MDSVDTCVPALSLPLPTVPKHVPLAGAWVLGAARPVLPMAPAPLFLLCAEVTDGSN